MLKTIHYPPPGIQNLFFLQVHGSSRAQLNTKDPLPTIAFREEVEATTNHVLETFYPVSPTTDLQQSNVYDVEDNIGFQKCYPYP